LQGGRATCKLYGVTEACFARFFGRASSNGF
jgi:hypothetical protein